MFDPVTRLWREPLISVLFPADVVTEITSMHVLLMIWKISWFGIVLRMVCFLLSLRICYCFMSDMSMS